MTVENGRRDFVSTIAGILDKTDGDAIGLPNAPGVPAVIETSIAGAFDACLTEIGVAADSDEFRCSRDRYLTMASIVHVRLSCGSRLLVGYAAPGHLPLLLEKAGYDVSVFDPNPHWRERYNPKALADRWPSEVLDLDGGGLSAATGSVDAVVLTGVLERLFMHHPRAMVAEVRRVLRPSGLVILTTPNVCNISNVVSLLQGNNVFWDTDIFYGGTDRHNREYTPREARALFEGNGFEVEQFFGMNDHANWRSGSAHHVYDFQAINGDVDHPLMRNTIIGVFKKA
ncbi:2-polyprenyl-3-methyl-5-hydroxy-6-metoxy-1,4-benzoquinol methylase [Novosphingobium hassiacum]|uniref:2-polyprenyl-3-methyl-5-hydroxy-6-metoxy-1, 4-benzoquinol methylase n=1 Tax=Novosphingobium hassiacum TaxID=173676 RepID=A0A7W5ZVU9_9SPHN|nr:methyltransferase domain-containing protein [Novosphingobium hassiacum]MBB3859409.1 2-polyprenyl-3-methyl-5-hydroxy-6-metoxy-1,4-benzoquinol methylase [Novosphingobium hassiacum]